MNLFGSLIGSFIRKLRPSLFIGKSVKEVHNVSSTKQTGGITAHTVSFERRDRMLGSVGQEKLLTGLGTNKSIAIRISATLGDTEAVQLAN